MIGQRAPVRTWPRATLLFGLPLLVALTSSVTTAIGALILWRRPGHAMGPGDLRQTVGGAVEPPSTTVWLRGARP
jgi:hypothetical protein